MASGPHSEGRGNIVARPVFAITGLLVALTAMSGAAQTPAKQVSDKDAKSLNLVAYTELLRSDVRSQKVAIITEMMAFTEAEDAVFWPIYREYAVEMAKLGDERIALITEYAKNYSTLTDPVADQLAGKALDLEARRQALKAKYFDRFKTALSPRTALRFLQVEHQLLLLIDLQVSAALPIVQ